jgi:hypothetical protein
MAAFPRFDSCGDSRDGRLYGVFLHGRPPPQRDRRADGPGANRDILVLEAALAERWLAGPVIGVAIAIARLPPDRSCSLHSDPATLALAALGPAAPPREPPPAHRARRDPVRPRGVGGAAVSARRPIPARPSRAPAQAVEGIVPMSSRALRSSTARRPLRGAVDVFVRRLPPRPFRRTATFRTQVRRELADGGAGDGSPRGSSERPGRVLARPRLRADGIIVLGRSAWMNGRGEPLQHERTEDDRDAVTRMNLTGASSRRARARPPG